jgi:replicative DNA helicase
MAKELDIPVILPVSAFPRTRVPHRQAAMLSDLRESGAIEQDADSVLFLYREDYYNPDTDRRNIAECIIAKNRHGSTGKVELQWLGQFTRFSTQERVAHGQ